MSAAWSIFDIAEGPKPARNVNLKIKASDRAQGTTVSTMYTREVELAFRIARIF